MMYYIFIDFDGTLSGMDGKVPSSAIEAIHKARAKGNQVFLCTGRSKSELYDWILAIGFDGIIGAGGGYVEVDGKVIFDVQFTHAQMLQIISYLEEQQVDFIMESHHGLYGSSHCKEHLKAVLPQQEQTYLDEVKFNISLKQLKGINKVVFLHSKITVQEIKKHFGKDYQIIPSTVPIFGKESGEIAIKDVHKASAIAQLLEYRQVDHQCTIAYGDGFNDREMLEYVQIGVAMKNSPIELLKIADDVTETAENNGLYLSFQKYGLL